MEQGQPVTESEDRSIRVFNKANQPIFWFVGDEEWKLPAGHWSEVPRDLGRNYLWKDRNVLIDWGEQPEAISSPLRLPHLLFASPLNCVTGFGNVGLGLLTELHKRFWLHPYPVGYWAAGEWRREILPRELQELIERAEHFFTEWALAVTIPTELSQIPAKRIFLYSMWETDRLPPGWVEPANRYARRIIVPCETQAKVWRDSGVRTPISVIALGVDAAIWNYEMRPRRAEGEPFRILVYGLLSSRKSPIETLTAVCWKALAKESDWELIFKTRQGQLGGGQFMPIIEEPRVRIINTAYTPREMVALCRQADVGIFLSKYEGFGLPPREMMATGLPVIWTAHSGHLADCFRGAAIDIPISHIIPAQEAYAGLGGWGEPNWDFAADALRFQYEDWQRRGRMQSPFGELAARYIAEHRTWAHTADRLAKLIAQEAA